MRAEALSRSALGALMAIGVGACTQVRDPPQGDLLDPNEETMEILLTVPESGATGVEHLPQIDLCFDRYLDPASADSFDVVLGSGSLVFDTEQELQPYAWREPGRARELAEQAWCPGAVLSVTPKSPLQAGVLYRIRVQSSLRGWDGEDPNIEAEGWQIREDGRAEYVVEFQISEDEPEDDTEGGSEPPPAPRTLDDLFAAGSLLDPAAGSCACHQDEDDVARELLDLSGPDIAFSELLGDPSPRATGFPMVTPRRPASSYFLHKMMHEDGAPLRRVRGVVMPSDGITITHRELAEVAQWIADGALR